MQPGDKVRFNPKSIQKVTCSRQYKSNLLIGQLLFNMVLVTVEHQVPQEQNIIYVKDKQSESVGVSLCCWLFSLAECSKCIFDFEGEKNTWDVYHTFISFYNGKKNPVILW